MLIALIAMSAVAGLVMLDKAMRDWRAATDSRAELSWRAMHVIDAIGYGGFIHNFKNAILRPEAPVYLDAAAENIEQALTNLAAFDAAAATLGVSPQTREIWSTLERYRAKLGQLPQLLKLGLAPRRIDELVRVSDIAALRDIEQLLIEADSAVETAHAQSANLARTAAALGVGAALALLAVVVAAAFHRAKSHARRDLEREVAERTADLSAALAREQHLSALQRRFVGLVSHEFRTPLSIIDLKMSQTVRKASRSCDAAAQTLVHDAASQVRTAVARLVHLIDTTLMASRIDEGHIGFNPEQVDLATLLKEAQEACLELFDGRDFVLSVEEGLGVAHCDPVHLRQILWNLLSNAAKYSDEGARIETDARRAEGGDEIVITVRDSGLGIGPADLARLTERYFRGESGEGRPGVGLGLHIVSKLLAMHGGRLEAHSELGRGSAFSAIFPASAASASQDARAA